MSNQDNETIHGVQFHIVSFGDDGHMAAEMLAQTHLMPPGGTEDGRCFFTKLTPLMTEKDIEAITRNIDMVFILGSDDKIEYKNTLSLLLDNCLENAIRCYSILSIKNSASSDNDIISVCERTNNTLLLAADQSISNVGVFNLMKEAVLNVTNPLLGRGILAVDFDDIKTVMRCGKTAQFSTVEVTGSQFAKQAVHDAIHALPSPDKALAILCNIEAGSDFSLDTFNAVYEEIDKAVGEQCTTINCSTFNPHADVLKVLVTAFY